MHESEKISACPGNVNLLEVTNLSGIYPGSREFSRDNMLLGVLV